jgi:hypothetical protein
MPEFDHDAFLSHASEDKSTFVEPLARELTKLALRFGTTNSAYAWATACTIPLNLACQILATAWRCSVPRSLQRIGLEQN